MLGLVDKLLLEINNNFQEYINDFEYIKNNFTQIDYNTDLDYNIDLEQTDVKDIIMYTRLEM